MAEVGFTEAADFMAAEWADLLAAHISEVEGIPAERLYPAHRQQRGRILRGRPDRQAARFMGPLRGTLANGARSLTAPETFPAPAPGAQALGMFGKRHAAEISTQAAVIGHLPGRAEEHSRAKAADMLTRGRMARWRSAAANEERIPVLAAGKSPAVEEAGWSLAPMATSTLAAREASR